MLNWINNSITHEKQNDVRLQKMFVVWTRSSQLKFKHIESP